MNKIQGLALDPSQPLRSIQLPEWTKMIHRARRPLQLIPEYACGRFGPFAAANARGSQSLHLASNYLGRAFVGSATSKSTVRTQTKLIEGNYNELRKGTRKGSAGVDLEPNPEDKNFRVYQLSQNIFFLGRTDLATIMGSSNCRLSFAVSLLLTKAESERFRLSPTKATRSASIVLS